MHYLYASKRRGTPPPCRHVRLREQLRAYVRWATLKDLGEGHGKFEQGSSLASYDQWAILLATPLNEEDASADVDHNPTPSMS